MRIQYTWNTSWNIPQTPVACRSSPTPWERPTFQTRSDPRLLSYAAPRPPSLSDLLQPNLSCPFSCAPCCWLFSSIFCSPYDAGALSFLSCPCDPYRRWSRCYCRYGSDSQISRWAAELKKKRVRSWLVGWLVDWLVGHRQLDMPSAGGGWYFFFCLKTNFRLSLKLLHVGQTFLFIFLHRLCFCVLDCIASFLVRSLFSSFTPFSNSFLWGWLTRKHHTVQYFQGFSHWSVQYNLTEPIKDRGEKTVRTDHDLVARIKNRAVSTLPRTGSVSDHMKKRHA